MTVNPEFSPENIDCYKVCSSPQARSRALARRPQAPINIECFMDDIDVKGKMERDDFAEMCQPLFAKCQAVIERAFAECGLGPCSLCIVFGC